MVVGILILIFLAIGTISGVMALLDNDCCFHIIIFIISFVFIIAALIYIETNYKDTRQEDCLSAGGTYVDIPGQRGCIYGGINK